MAKPELRPDIQSVRDHMANAIGASREFKNLESIMWEGETARMACSGTYGRGTGLLVLTNTRLLFTFHGIMGQTNEDFPFDKISSIQWSSGMLTGTVTIFASGNKAEVKNVNKDDGKNLVDKVRGIISGQTSAAHPVAVPPTGIATDQRSAPPPPPPSMPAGWYQDPSNPHLQRYWDNGWTEHTAPAAH